MVHKRSLRHETEGLRYIFCSQRTPFLPHTKEGSYGAPALFFALSLPRQVGAARQLCALAAHLLSSAIDCISL